jgi:Domain of unknown function (DUF5668)
MNEPMIPPIPWADAEPGDATRGAPARPPNEFTAPQGAHDARRESMSEMRVSKSPALAGILSALPGLGQAYVGYYLAGFTNIMVVGALIAMMNSRMVRGLEPFFGLFLAFFWIFNILDAARRARLYNLHQLGEQSQSMPTDSPLIGGIILSVLGLFLTLEITFDMDLDFLEDYWPLFLLGLGVYMIVKYRRTKRELEGNRHQAGE